MILLEVFAVILVLGGILKPRVIKNLYYSQRDALDFAIID